MLKLARVRESMFEISDWVHRIGRLWMPVGRWTINVRDGLGYTPQGTLSRSFDPGWSCQISLERRLATLNCRRRPSTPQRSFLLSSSRSVLALWRGIRASEAKESAVRQQRARGLPEGRIERLSELEINLSLFIHVTSVAKMPWGCSAYSFPR